MNRVKVWVLAALPVVAIGAALLTSIPQMRRYLRMRKM